VEWTVHDGDADAQFRWVDSDLMPGGNGLSIAAGLFADRAPRVLLLRRRKGNYGPRVPGLARLPEAPFAGKLD